jgi:Tol biopolymer transport system component
MDPSWAPDGVTLAILAEEEGKLIARNIDTHVGFSITLNSADVSEPAWSLDSHKVGYTMVRFGGTVGLYVVNVPEGNGVATPLVESPGFFARNLAWRP